MSSGLHPVIQVAQESGGDLLESPFWSTATNSLFYVDIDGKKIHQYKLDTEKHRSWKTNQRVGFICPVSSSPQVDTVMGGLEDGLYWLDLSSTEDCVEEQIWSHNMDTHIVRFNDGKCDSSGRLFAGLMDYQWQEKSYSEAQGKFYSFESSQRLRKADSKKPVKRKQLDKIKSQEVLSKICCSNGLTWLSDYRHLFYIDSGKYEILCYPYDIQTGKIDKDSKQTLVRLDKKLWVALCGAGVVLQIDAATGKELMRISVGCKYPTSRNYAVSRFQLSGWFSFHVTNSWCKKLLQFISIPVLEF
ncbi:Regucalcin [Galdieria sulphuraria]|nr:Regucalcin [Galdieria sulphuraria]